MSARREETNCPFQGKRQRDYELERWEVKEQAAGFEI